MPKQILRNDNIAIKECKHGLFTYLVNDLFIGKSLDLYGEWAEGEITVLSKAVMPGAVIVDAGANIGTHTIALAKLLGPNNFVYAFEPQRIIYHLLCANVALNNLYNVKCFNNGLSDQNGQMLVPILDTRIAQNFGGLNIQTCKEGDVVNITTIDSLNLNACHLIKIDVEGMEEKVLRGSLATIDKYGPILYVENNRTESSSDLLKIIDKLGYKAYWHILDYHNPKNYFENAENVFAKYAPEANLICIPNNSHITMKGFIDVIGLDDDWKKALLRLD